MRDMPTNDHDLLITIATQTQRIIEDIDAMKTNIEKDYVKNAEFIPVKNIAYTIVYTVGVAVLLALVAVIIQK